MLIFSSQWGSSQPGAETHSRRADEQIERETPDRMWPSWRPEVSKFHHHRRALALPCDWWCHILHSEYSFMWVRTWPQSVTSAVERVNNSCCKKTVKKIKRGLFSDQICVIDVEEDSLFVLTGVMRCCSPLFWSLAHVKLRKKSWK